MTDCRQLAADLIRRQVTVIAADQHSSGTGGKKRRPLSDLCGKCLFSQYLTSMGFNPEPTSEYTFDTWALHLYFGEVASMKPFTFGAALERAKRLDACSNNN
jgi:hypothetical protein